MAKSGKGIDSDMAEHIRRNQHEYGMTVPTEIIDALPDRDVIELYIANMCRQVGMTREEMTTRLTELLRQGKPKGDNAKRTVLEMQERRQASHVLVMGAVFCHPDESEQAPGYSAGTPVALYARPGFAHPPDGEPTQAAYYEAIAMRPEELRGEAEAQLGTLRQYCLAHQLRVVKEYAWIRPGNYVPPLCCPKHSKAMFDEQKAGKFAAILLVSNRNEEVVVL